MRALVLKVRDLHAGTGREGVVAPVNVSPPCSPEGWHYAIHSRRPQERRSALPSLPGNKPTGGKAPTLATTGFTLSLFLILAAARPLDSRPLALWLAAGEQAPENSHQGSSRTRKCACAGNFQGHVNVVIAPRRGARRIAVGATYGKNVEKCSTPTGSNVHGRPFPWVSPTATHVCPLRGLPFDFAHGPELAEGRAASTLTQSWGNFRMDRSQNGGEPLAVPSYTENRGRWTFGIQMGYSIESATVTNFSHINLVVAQPQLGLIVKNYGPNFMHVARSEVLLEGFLADAFHPGGNLRGQAFIFRFDGRAHGRWVPFFDFGGGIMNTDLYRKAPELSGPTQFNAQGGPGVQFFFRPQRAFVLQYRFLHISNGGMILPNIGANSSMMTIGFRWLRRPGGAASKLR